MPRCNDISSILIIGSGPIIIGQACEFDYSGSQALRALKEEGYRLILVNSNPATIMTDPELSDATYIEPLTAEYLERIIAKERPDALLATLGGQTALNCALELNRLGILEKYQVQLIGVSVQSIECAENRDLFQKTMKKIGLEVPKTIKATTMAEAEAALKELGLPVIVRSSFSLGGSGAGVAYNKQEFSAICQKAFNSSFMPEIMLDEALLGWKEFELEVVRDSKDNCIVVCGVENIDPLGIHTGDSITVAPIQTLTDKEYQKMRQAAFAVLREVGVDTGGSNVQFAVQPETGRMVVIEMNPRVSRSSALVSKASGFPIAKIAAKLAVGYTLDELKNDITGGKLPASFEPALDYVVIKIPRFHDEKFKGTAAPRGPQMKSVGEVMAIGRTFAEALQKAMCSLEIGSAGFDLFHELSDVDLKKKLQDFTPTHLWGLGEALRRGLSVQDLYKLTNVDPWFLHQIQSIIQAEAELETLENISRDTLLQMKRLGFSDTRLAQLGSTTEDKIAELRVKHQVRPVYKRVDSCAGEFHTPTAYLYSTYEQVCEASPSDKRKVIILGSGPNRIGQGIEFDYCCVHAIQAFSASGYETIMINCNPETVSTDYDIVDRLYFAPLTFESVFDIVQLEKPEGVVLQFGGQTPLKLAKLLSQAGVKLLGLDLDVIECTEDREQFRALLRDLQLKQPRNASALSVNEGIQVALDLGFPLIIRPSFVLGGEGMLIVRDEESLKARLEPIFAKTDFPVLLEAFLNDAVEIDVDAISDGHDVFIPIMLEHIELAGVHSGDSACITPPQHLSIALEQAIRQQTTKIIRKLKVKGIFNIQFAIQGEEIYIIEVNPRASRTSPFICKATGLPLIQIAVNCILGQSLASQGYVTPVKLPYCCIKESVLPFKKFPLADVGLSPEMKSTGEVMGIGDSPQEAFMKAQKAAGNRLPGSGVIWAVGFDDHQDFWSEKLVETFTICSHIKEVCQLEVRPDLIFALNAPGQSNGPAAQAARFAVDQNIPHATTLEACKYIVSTLKVKKSIVPEVRSLQDLYKIAPYKPRHILIGTELSPTEVTNIIDQAIQLKVDRSTCDWPVRGLPLRGKNLAMIFDKPSFRTRFSFAVAIQELGGHIIESVSTSRKQEDPRDLAGVLNGYCDIIAIRTHDDKTLKEMAQVSNVPIINALSALYHPCQTLADLMTLQEVFGCLNGLTIAYIGDGNNILHSLMLMAPQLGVNVNYCCPTQCLPDTGIVQTALERTSMIGAGTITSCAKPQEAVRSAKAVYTDVWTSMGFESRDKYFEGFRIDEQLMEHADPLAVFMHCMPMERGKEVSKTLPDDPCSVIYRQSENRLHVQKALMLFLLEKMSCPA